jgi:hypothetical protein
MKSELHPPLTLGSSPFSSLGALTDEPIYPRLCPFPGFIVSRKKEKRDKEIFVEKYFFSAREHLLMYKRWDAWRINRMKK